MNIVPRPTDGTVYLDWLTWDGTPEVTFARPASGTMWRRAWVHGIDHHDHEWPETYRVVQNSGTGLLIQGTREWTDYRVSAVVTPHLMQAGGIGARVQGMRRYYALLLRNNGTAQLVKALDGSAVLAETAFPWEFGATYTLTLQVVGSRVQGWIDDRLLFDVRDHGSLLSGGGVALICEAGRMAAEDVRVTSAEG